MRIMHVYCMQSARDVTGILAKIMQNTPLPCRTNFVLHEALDSSSRRATSSPLSAMDYNTFRHRNPLKTFFARIVRIYTVTCAYAAMYVALSW